MNVEDFLIIVKGGIISQRGFAQTINVAETDLSKTLNGKGTKVVLAKIADFYNRKLVCTLEPTGKKIWSIE